MRLFHAALLAVVLAAPASAATPANDLADDAPQNVQIYNEQNERLGEANLIIVNEAGQPEGIVVKVREMDTPQIEVIVPVDRIKNATADRKLVIAATMDEIKAMPRLQLEDKDKAPDPGTNISK